MRIFLNSAVCFLFLLSNKAYCDPPYFSIVNDNTLGLSHVDTMVFDGTIPVPQSSGSLNIPTPNYTVDSLSRSITKGNSSASAAIGPDEQAGTSVTGSIQLNNVGATPPAQVVTASGLANYHVYDPNDPSNTTDVCGSLIKIECSGDFDWAMGSFYCNVYLDGGLIGSLKGDGEGGVYFEGDGIHIPTYYDAGTIEHTYQYEPTQEEPMPPVTGTVISVLCDQYIIDVPLGSTLSVDAGVTSYTNFNTTEDAQGAASFYVWIIGLDIY